MQYVSSDHYTKHRQHAVRYTAHHFARCVQKGRPIIAPARCFEQMTLKQHVSQLLSNGQL